jgi:hypothetical protein
MEPFTPEEWREVLLALGAETARASSAARSAGSHLECVTAINRPLAEQREAARDRDDAEARLAVLESALAKAFAFQRIAFGAAEGVA